jgi:prepilin-type N-terminal cleavage/methylation domain-containing protein
MNRQKGFTLLEILLALVIGGAALTAALAVYFELMWGNGRIRGVAMSGMDANNAALAIQKDLVMTQSSNLTNGDPTPQSSVTFSWTDYTGFESSNYSTHYSSYGLAGTTLWRTYDGAQEIVGRKITNLGFTRQDRVINVVITSTEAGPPETDKTVEFSVLTRAEELEE